MKLFFLRPMVRGTFLGAVMVLPFVSVHLSAQETHTNASMGVTFALTAYIQESKDTNSPVWTTSTRKFGNADLIQTLATDFGFQTNDFPPASLNLIAKDVNTNYHLSFFLQTAAAEIDISSNLDFTIPQQFNTVSSVTPAPQGRSTNATDRSILVVDLFTTNASFRLQGPVKLDSSSLSLKNQIVNKNPFTHLLTATVAGSGKIDGKDAVFTGTVKTAKRKIEIEPGP